jgi:hypothetical protein
MTYKAKIIVDADTWGWGESKRILPALDVDLEMTVNWDGIYKRFGAKAARSKGRRASLLGGLIKIKAVRIKERE